MSSFPLPNPKALKQALVTVGMAETLVIAKKCKVWGVTCQFDGSTGAAGTIALRDAAATGGGSTPVITVSKGPNSAVAGDGNVFQETFNGLVFRNGLTVTGGAKVAGTVLYEEDGP